MAPNRSIVPKMMITGDTYFNNAKAVNARKTRMRVGIVVFKKDTLLVMAFR